MAMLPDAPNGRPDWDENNPLEAVRDFVRAHEEFEVDPAYNRIGVSYCPEGFLRRCPGD